MKNQAGRVVVGYDGTLSSVRALDWATAEAQRRELPLTIMHIVKPLTAIARAADARHWPELFENEGREIVELGAQRARMTTSIDIATENSVARVSGTLIAATGQARLLVLGSPEPHAPTGIARHSVARTVSAGAYCPCVVVRGDSSALAGPQRPIVVGVDGTPGSRVALRYAAAVAVESSAVLRVVAAYRSPGTRSAADHAVESAVDQALVRFPELIVSTQTSSGPVASVLSETAHGAGLLVIGPRRHTGPVRVRPGSVSHGLLSTAPCPIVFVHQAWPVPGTRRGRTPRETTVS